MLTVQGTSFQLRPWRPEDAPSLAEQANNVNISANLRDSFPYPYAEADAQRYIECARMQSPLRDFAIVADGKAVGGISVAPLSDVERFSAEIGYWIGESYWNRGIVSEAVRTLSDYLLAHTNLVRLFACVYAGNLASARVLEKSGFRLVGVLRKAAFKNNCFVDMRYYERVE
jgi:RimJ/RimL family protein N-acetyltransferase